MTNKLLKIRRYLDFARYDGHLMQELLCRHRTINYTIIYYAIRKN
jgi:hypothetical protein